MFRLFHQNPISPKKYLKNIFNPNEIPLLFFKIFITQPHNRKSFWILTNENGNGKKKTHENRECRREKIRKWILPLIFCFNPPREDDRCNAGIQLELPPKSQPFENLETLDDSLAFQMLGILEVKCLELLPFRFPSPKLWIFGIPGIPDIRNSCQNYSQTNRAYSFFHLTVL